MSDILTSPNLQKNARHRTDGGLSNDVTLISGTSGKDRDLVLCIGRATKPVHAICRDASSTGGFALF